MGKSYFTFLVWFGFILGLPYLAAGGMALYNWYLTVTGEEPLLSNFIPSDLGVSMVFITTGALLVAPLYYTRLKPEHTKALSALLLGSGLSVVAMVIQLLVAAASWLDGLIVGEPLSPENLYAIITRSDALLGCFALPLFYATLRILQHGGASPGNGQPR
ncbi:MAG: hypothetical protein ABWK01_04450 [Infirmifilum sp.]